MELLHYFRIFRRWLWLILLAAFIGGSLSFISRLSQAPLYQTQVTIAIGNYLESPNPSSAEIYTGIDLAWTYAELVTTYNVMNGVVESLDLPFGVDRLASMTKTEIIGGTSLLQIEVIYTDPVLAADITNAIAEELILSSPSNLTPEQQAQVDILQDEMEAQRNELQNLRRQVEVLDLQLNDSNLSDTSRQALRNERSNLVDQINVASSNIAQFTNTIASFQQRSNSVEIVESARIPTSAVGSNLFLSVFVAAMVAAALAFGAVLAYEYLNDSFRTTDEVSQTMNLPVLGVISHFGKKTDSYQERLISNLPNFSQTSEEFRTLRTNLLYTNDKRKRIFVVSSASPQEGKSVTTSNLAVSMALSGLKVLLIDADLRRPRVQEVFDIPNTLGLSNILSRKMIDPLAEDLNWTKVIQKCSIPNLFIIPCGFIPKNPAELLGSMMMKRLAEQLMASSNVDVIIFDSPPVLAVSDSAVLAASLDAKVLLVIQAGQTRRSIAQKAKERFNSIHVEIAGIVFNGVDLRDEDYYGHSYGYYYTDDANAQEPSKG